MSKIRTQTEDTLPIVFRFVQSHRKNKGTGEKERGDWGEAIGMETKGNRLMQTLGLNTFELNTSKI